MHQVGKKPVVITKLAKLFLRVHWRSLCQSVFPLCSALNACISHAYTTIPAQLFSTRASPMQSEKNNNMPVFMLCFPLANTVCRPAENKTVPPVPCVWRCCYLYLTNVFSLAMPKSEATIQTVEVVCATSEPERWSCDGWKRREQKQTDVCSDSETSVFSTMAQKDGKQRAAAVYSRTLLLFLPLVWRACNEFSSLTLGTSPDKISVFALLTDYSSCVQEMLKKIWELHIYSPLFRELHE